MSEWKLVKLRDYVDSISRTYKFSNNPVVFLNTSDVLEGKVLHKNLSHPNSLPGQAKKSIQKGDILYSEIRPANKRYAFIDFDAENYVVSTKLMVLRAKGNINKSYLGLHLTSNETLNFLQSAAEDRSGSFPQITFDNIKDLELLLPPLPEQQAIAEVLSSLDDKIDLLHRNNKTLEEMAETLFRQWFDIEENEQNTCRLGSVIKTTSGGTPSRNNDSYYRGSIPWVKSKELSGGFITKTEEHLTETGLKNSSAKLLPENSVLLAMYGATVGEVCIIPFQATCNQAICALLPSNAYPYTWIHNFLKFKKEDIINLATGAAQQNISQIIIQDLLVPKPSDKITTYHQNTNVLYQKILNNTIQIENLKTTRDTLLPKLMSGQVRVQA